MVIVTATPPIVFFAYASHIITRNIIHAPDQARAIQKRISGHKSNQNLSQRIINEPPGSFITASMAIMS